jgi:hypothetical protein
LSDLECLIAGLTVSQTEKLKAVLQSVTSVTPDNNLKTRTITSSTNDSQTDTPELEDLPALIPALEEETPGPVSAQNKELVPAEEWAVYNNIPALSTPSPPSPGTSVWKEESSLLKEELKRAVAVINGVVSALDLATADGAIATESNASPTKSNTARDYHVPLPSETGTFFVVTKGKQVGVFCGWYVFSFLVDLSLISDFRSQVAPLVLGVSRACYHIVDDIAMGCAIMDSLMKGNASD